MTIKEKLNTPFPFLDSTRKKIYLSLFFSLFIYIFLVLYQPFGIIRIKLNKSIFIFGYLIITFLTIFISLFLNSKLTSKINKDKWTIIKMFYFILFQTLLISIFNWFYTTTFGKEITSEQYSYSLLKFVIMTFSIGIIPTSFFLLFIERILNSRKEREAKKLTDNFSIISNHKQNINIKLGTESELSIILSDLLCIKVDGNYTEIYTLEKGITKKHLIRCSLSKIKQQLEAYHQIKHCHRSFIVNTQHVIKVTGNARNFNLHLDYLDFSIPVSRSFPINTIKK